MAGVGAELEGWVGPAFGLTSGAGNTGVTSGIGLIPYARAKSFILFLMPGKPIVSSPISLNNSSNLFLGLVPRRLRRN